MTSTRARHAMRAASPIGLAVAGPHGSCRRHAPRRAVAAGMAIVLMLAAGMAVLIGLGFATPLGAQLSNPSFPALTGQVVDEAGLLQRADRIEIIETLSALEGKSTDQLIVVTVKSLQGYAVEDYALRLARHWKIGQAGTNNGVVLLVAPNERKVRIEVGRGLEGQMTDAMSALIIQNAILPAFRRGDFAAGIRAGVRDIRDVLLGDAQAVKDRASRLKPRGDDVAAPLITFLIYLLVIALIIYLSQRNRRAQPAGSGTDKSDAAGNRRRKRPEIIIIPGGWGGSGNWGGGSSGGGWSGGGGGSCGGGGASGSW